MNIYKHPDVQGVEYFYGTLLSQFDQFSSISGHLSAVAERMWEGVQNQERIVLKQISNYHPKFLGWPTEKLRAESFTLEDCRKTIACEYGFGEWPDVEDQGGRAYDVDFERAVDDLLSGRHQELHSKLSQQPGLISRTSRYGHRATLLHYSAANGVEVWRQKVPQNLPTLVELMLDLGADPSAKMLVYNGEYTTLELLKSSVHPDKAGLKQQLLEILTSPTL